MAYKQGGSHSFRMYKLIGGDQKEYGPATLDEVMRWIAEGRANSQTLAKAEGTTEWRQLATFPEFAEALGIPPAGAATPPPLEPATGLPPGVLDRDYEIDIGQCISNAWDLVMRDFGVVVGGVSVIGICFLLSIGVSSALRLFGPAELPMRILLNIASFVLTGPLLGGAYYLLLRRIRQQPAEAADVFAGFRFSVGQLILGYIVSGLLTTLAALPGLIIMFRPLYLMLHQQALAPGMLLEVMVGFVLAMIPAMYLGVCWVFTLPLIIDKQMSFWPAMGASRRMVSKHWWTVFALMVVCGILNVAGVIACCVGIFISLPVVFGALMYGYERIFSAAGPARA